MYSLLLETYIKDTVEKQRLFRAIDTIPAVKKKADWALKWIGRYVVNFGGISTTQILNCTVGDPLPSVW